MVPIIFKVILSVSWCSCYRNVIEASKIYSSDILISNLQFPIFNFPIFILNFNPVSLEFFSIPKPKSFEIESS